VYLGLVERHRLPDGKESSGRREEEILFRRGKEDVEEPQELADNSRRL
jgi:hypothetical protein